jgi:hypothetical protein
VRTEHGDAALFKEAEQRQLKGFAAPVGVVECVWSTNPSADLLTRS